MNYLESAGLFHFLEWKNNLSETEDQQQSSELKEVINKVFVLVLVIRTSLRYHSTK